MNEPTFLGHTSERSGPNSGARLLFAAVVHVLSFGRVDYHPNANRKWCVGERGRGYTLREAALDARRKRGS